MLTEDFLAPYRLLPVPMDALGQFTYLRTYSRNGETWVDTCARVINGMYWLQNLRGPKWDEDKAGRSAREAFDLLFHLKWSPPGRGLWVMGTDFVQRRMEVEALQNCAFISSAHIKQERGDFFRWLMEMSMLGVGVGFDTDGGNKIVVSRPSDVGYIYEIPDTRQGWAESVKLLVDSYLGSGVRPSVEFDYTQIRAAGQPILSFGGVASGPEPLQRLHNNVRRILTERIGGRLSSMDIMDISNLIGECVIAGNVRRSAEIALGDGGDRNFIRAKLPESNRPWGWVSNNSLKLHGGETPSSEAVEGTYLNGEPGYVWMDNIHRFGRMNGREDYADKYAVGVNPCAEQVLHHREMCTLAEIYLPRLSSKSEFAKVIKYAYLYAKAVTCGSEYIGDSKSKVVMEANRRIGLSLTGVAQFVTTHGEDVLRDWMEYGYQLSAYYDDLYSEWLGVPNSVRRTSIKPSGTVSLLAGVTPGIHYPVSRTYIRRVNLAANSPLVDRIASAGYPLVQSVYSPDTLVVEFPIKLNENIRTEREVTMDEQLNLAAIASRYWADNSVSITVKFDRERDSQDDLANAISRAGGLLKAVSFLPVEDHGYEQAPYEEISEEEYQRRKAGVASVDFSGVVSHEMQDMFCDGESCEVSFGN